MIRDDICRRESDVMAFVEMEGHTHGSAFCLSYVAGSKPNSAGMASKPHCAALTEKDLSRKGRTTVG